MKKSKTHISCFEKKIIFSSDSSFTKSKSQKREKFKQDINKFEQIILINKRLLLANLFKIVVKNLKKKQL